MKNEELAMRTGFFQPSSGIEPSTVGAAETATPPAWTVSTQHRGTLAGLREVDASLEPRGVRADGIAMSTRHRER